MDQARGDQQVMQPLVCIIVLNWNGRNDTLECLESIARVDYPNFEVVVADNGSTDGSVEAIGRYHPEVKIIENHANLGFAEGNNGAIRHALETGADFIFLLNNDTVVDPGVVTEFVRAAQQMPQAGVFGAKIYHHADSRRLWYAGGYWDSRTLSFNEYGAGEIDRGQYDVLTETEWVIGCAMFIRAEVFRKVGLLEPRFFLNNEEIDFCSRAKRAGFVCLCSRCAGVAQDFGLLWRRRFTTEGIFQCQKPIVVGEAQCSIGVAVKNLFAQCQRSDSAFHSSAV